MWVKGIDVIEVKNLTKIYGKGENQFKALDAVNFRVDLGPTVAIIGKSGSGKSTLMHLMSGLDKADSGQVIVAGQDIQKMSQKEADRFRATDMSFIFQSFFVEANQTCFQNVSLPLEIADVPRTVRAKMITTALDKVELSDKIHEPSVNLSGGQKQRLAIARAIVASPKIIFADEPTGNLDSLTGEKVMDLLFGISKNQGTTLFIVTHDEDLAKKCQVQIKLHDGKVVDVKTKAKNR